MGTDRHRGDWAARLAVAGILLGALAGCTAAAAHARPPRVIPAAAAPRYTSHGSVDRRWVAQTARLRARVRADEGARLVLIGDSLTARWLTVGAPDWQAAMAPLGALDLGLSGDTTQNVLWRIERGELTGLQPRAVVLLIGTNDFADHWSPVEVTQGILAVAQRVRAVLPVTPVVLLALLPRGDYLFDPALVSQVDADLHRAEMPAGVTLIDLTSRFITLDGDLIAPLYMPDRLHLSNAGYEVLAAGIGPVVDPLLAGGPTR
ncbi:MAG: GDSL-type esterase/lipase family protein [Actinomycetota bacterium]|nr:GDSL-type esterase/lipase family protein [Actinomycetota bacterium]